MCIGCWAWVVAPSLPFLPSCEQTGILGELTVSVCQAASVFPRGSTNGNTLLVSFTPFGLSAKTHAMLTSFYFWREREGKKVVSCSCPWHGCSCVMPVHSVRNVIYMAFLLLYQAIPTSCSIKRIFLLGMTWNGEKMIGTGGAVWFTNCHDQRTEYLLVMLFYIFISFTQLMQFSKKKKKKIKTLRIMYSV